MPDDQIELLENRLAATQAELDGADKVIANLKSEIEDLKFIAGEWSDRYNVAADEREQWKGQAFAMQNERDAAKNQLVSAIESAQSTQTAHDKKVGEFQLTLDQLHERLTAERQEREALETTLDQLNREKAKLIEDVEFAKTHDLAVAKAAAARWEEGHNTQARLVQKLMKLNAELKEKLTSTESKILPPTNG